MAIKLDKSKIVRSLAIKNKLVPHLEKAIGEGDFVWGYQYEPKKGDDAWHPSGHCTPSLQELFLLAKNPEEESFGPGLYKTFQVGHFWHQYLQWLVEHKLGFAGPESIERKGYRVWGGYEDEIPAREEKSLGEDIQTYLLDYSTQYYRRPRPFHWATGAGDIAPCAIPGYGDFVVDFKTMGNHDFKRQGIPNWCSAKYECQINIYMDFFDEEQGMIVAIQKDTPHDIKEFSYTRNQPLIDAIYRKWELVSECLDADVEPPADEVISLPLRGPDA